MHELPLIRSVRSKAWGLTLAIMAVAALIRLPGLSAIPTIIFDETYYVKDGWSLTQLGYEGKWETADANAVPQGDPGAERDTINKAFARGDTSGLSSKAAYVVHPQTGKWLIGMGMRLFGQSDPVGWRIATAVAGVFCVMLVCRLAWHLSYSRIAVGLAGSFVTLDGVSIVLSRTGLLDVFLALFTLAAFLCIVLDYRMSSAVLHRKYMETAVPPLSLERRISLPVRGKAWLGPSAGRRPWMLAAGVFAGLAISVKWSGLYVLAALGIFVVLFEFARRRKREPHPFFTAVIGEGLPAFVTLVPTAAVVYVLSWWSWFAHSNAWGRVHSGVWGTLSDWWQYHLQMYEFHRGLGSHHSYMSSAPQWLLQLRPTSFAYQKPGGSCGSSECVQAVLALGNPLLWWLGAAALVLLVVVFAHRLWRHQNVFVEGVLLTGYAATYLPWFLYLDRTTFNFYTVVLAPFVALTLTWAVREVAALAFPRSPVFALLVVALVFTLVVVTALFFMPIWTGQTISYDAWHLRMWLPSWV
ncbi:phospholipid carrier-dependent glycosyltransferase [Gleimia hominis]|uniref:Polyprenol-phosphate-mannose--protein mannosyltransferase n=1 Tax=Gleimia hominis TaxID=595468 RepID=A0ABU3IC03_9ACTO|nr:phospholipid carrier-dependent glycosyltransferase [Gleimia hominis]MDT3767881.1 phospholipid carrier-dependent glycosyltransferase [Gleimia hominis]